MKQLLFTFLFLHIQSLVFSQVSEYKLFAKSKYEKVEKSVVKDLEKNSQDARASFVYGLLLNQKSYEKFSPENAYIQFENAKKFYYQSDEKTIGKLNKEGVIPDSIFYNRNITFDLGLEIAINKNTISDYEHFLNYYNGSISQKKKAESLRDVIAYNDAKSINTENSYVNFLRKYPNAEQKESAIKNRDICAFNDAKKAGNSQSVVTFLKKYPNSHLKEEAELEKNKLFFEEQTDGSIDGYIRFCNNNDKSYYFDLAVENIRKLSLQDRNIVGLKYLTSHAKYLKNYNSFQDDLF